MIRWWVFNKETDMCQGYFMVTIIMQRSINPAGGNQIKLLCKDQINT